MKFIIFFVLMGMAGQVNGQNQEATQTVGSFTIEVPQLRTEKKIWVWLPKNYESSGKQFPVMYVINGQNAFDGQWNIDETLDDIKAKAIVIGIEHKEALANLKEMDSYLEFIATTLKPHVDKTYRTKTDAADTTILGAGAPGLMAFYGGLKYPQTFGNVGCFSPVYVNYWQEIVSAMAKTPDFNKTRVYFLNGESTTEAVNYIEKWINTKRCECKKRNKRVSKDKPDDENLWHDGFKKAYLWLF